MQKDIEKGESGSENITQSENSGQSEIETTGNTDKTEALEQQATSSDNAVLEQPTEDLQQQNQQSADETATSDDLEESAESESSEVVAEDEPAPKKKKAKKSRTKKIVIRTLVCIFTPIIAVLIVFFSAASVIFYGPSATARDLAVVTAMETSAGKIIPQIFFSNDQIEDIMAKNAPVQTDEVTDQDLVNVPDDKTDEQKEEIEIIEVAGPTFTGKMMIIHDPSRVVVGTPPKYGRDLSGLRVEDMVEREGGIAGVNAGGFADDGGIGNGGTPLGIVIKDGELIWGSNNTVSSVIGFDENNKLIVGNMPASQALEMGVRDAVSFGPVFIVNGERVEVQGTGGGLNPRTVIGQREDGAVLLLAIDGRQAHSIGATLEDCIDVMDDFGAINAANLDGGSSTIMYYKGEVINQCASLYGSRAMATSFIVK